MTREEQEQLREDYKQDMFEEYKKEIELQEDADYCMEYFIDDDVKKCIKTVSETLKSIRKYHDIGFDELACYA